MQILNPIPKWVGEILRLMPLFLLYLVLSWLGNRDYLRGDESRYLVYARNILQGYFASEESLLFWNGPGYPLVLTPFVYGHMPLYWPRLANALFLFLAVVYFYHTLCLYGIKSRALLYAWIIGLALLFHGPLLDMLMSESLCALLICGSTFHFCSLASNSRFQKFHLIAAGLQLGYLIWTKVFFGYAVEVVFILAIAIWGLLKWQQVRVRTNREMSIPTARNQLQMTVGYAAAISGIALLFCLPYLAYTYAQTHKVHFWGNSGGLQLYCLTVPEKELTGDWLNFDMVRDNPEYFPVQAPLFMEIAKLDYLSRDEAFKKAAFGNILAYPGKFFWNWRANVNRLVFGFPVSPYPGADLELTTGNRSIAYALPFLVFLLAVIPGWKGRKSIPIAIHLVLGFALISLGGLSLLSGIPRQVFPLLPLVCLWTLFALEKAISWKLRWEIPASLDRT